MGELSIPILVYLVVFLALPFIFGYLARHFKLPLILGYMVSGIALSIFFREESKAILSIYANIGLLLLLFTVGLEVHFETISRFFRYVVIGGIAQIFVTSLVLFGMCVLFGFSFIPSLLLSIAFSFSSTAIVAKIVQERGEENTLFGQLSMGVLLFQDLMVIPVIIILTSLHNGDAGFALTGTIIFLLIKSILLLSFIYFVGTKFVPIVFERIGRVSGELLNIFSVLFILISVYIFSLFGLSGTLAAFIAGLLVGHTTVHTKIFSQIRPIRDIFVILFFVFLGATLDVMTHWYLLLPILIFSIFLVIIKCIVTTVVFVRLKFHTKASFAIGTYLAQVGEFAFIILTMAKVVHIIDDKIYFFGIGVTLFSMIYAPISINFREKLYKKIRGFMKKYIPSLDNYIAYGVDRHIFPSQNAELKNHVIICGYGQIGKQIGRALHLADISFIAIDYNYYVVKHAQSENIPIIYGDPSDSDILESVSIKEASCLVSVLPDMIAQEAVLLKSRALNPDIVLFARVRDEQDQKRMKDLGAQIVVQPEFEASLAVIKKILSAYKLSQDEISGKVKRLKIEHGMA